MQDDVVTRQSPTGDKWLLLAREAYDSSTEYIDTNYRDSWEDSIRHFQSRHTASSKYSQIEWKYRSKMFRPKTRSIIRNTEAAGVAAFFANQDVVSINPRNINSPFHIIAAAVNDELMNYHLTESIPWYMICIGALQDAQVIGVVASYQTWLFKEDEQGRVLEDRPDIELIPIENIRIHPSAKWPKPAQTSPYLIRLVPMYVQDVEARMRIADPKTGAPKWKKYSRAEMTAAMTDLYDETRETREQTGEDKYYMDKPLNSDLLGEYDIVWCHENFIRYEGKDVVYWTIGTEYRLSDPVPIEAVYATSERPIVIGYCILETHKLFPSGVAELGKGLQKELNENINIRLDNQKLAMNKRYFAKRGAQVDIASLLKNVAGSVTLMDDTVGDVRVVDFNDINPSSYAEQDRLNLDIDELLGAFSPSTVQSNRKLNETVGGMQMLRGSANSLAEYLLRTFAESWVEPVLKQVLRLIQEFEDDQERLGLALLRSGMAQQYGIPFLTSNLLKQDVVLRVDVGMGATDPVYKLQNFLMGVKEFAMIAAQISKGMPPGTLNLSEVGKEIFGRLGFKDGSRFLSMNVDQDAEKQQLTMLLQQTQAQLQQLALKEKDKSEDRQARLLETQIREEGQDRRTAAELAVRIQEKEMDLQNPAAGEQPVNRGGNAR